MSVSLMPIPKQAFFYVDNSGRQVPMVGGKVYTYLAGTSTPAATYTSSTGATANAWPVILDARGEASVWLSPGLYKIVLKDANDVEIYTQDGVSGTGLYTVFDDMDTLIANVGTFDGQLAFICGYHAVGDGGSGFFRWNAASTATHDGGITIKATASATGRWKRIYSGAINAAWFGLVPDGSTNNYDQLAAASALAAGGALYIPAGEYYIDDTLPLYSNTTYYGDGENSTAIKQNTADAPVMASTGYLGGASPTGNCVIRDLRVIGGASAGVLNHGIVLRDYYSTIENVRVTTTNGDSIHITTRNSSSVEVGGTLVENRVLNVNLTNPGGYGIYAGELDNNKLTDGFIQNVTMNLSATSPDGIYIGSSAGWTLDGIHTYDTPAGYAIRVGNAYHTNIDNIYIEAFTNGGIFAQRTQRALAMSNINVRNEVAGKPAVRIDKSSSVTTADVSISNLMVTNNSAAAVYGIKTDSTAVYVTLGAHRMENKGAGSITLLDMSNKERCLRVTDAVVDGSMRDSANLAGLVYGGTMIQSFSANNRIEAVNPAVEITETIAIGPINSYRAMAGLLTIKLRSNYNGTVRATYCGMIHIQAKLNGSNSWVVSLDQIIAAAGLTTGPTATIADNGDGTGTLTVKFTPTNTDAYGALTLNLSASENA